MSVLLFSAESHDVFDAGAVVPAAVENDELARSRKLLDVSLGEHLCLFPVRRRRECNDTKDARTDPLGDCLDGSAFPRGVAAVEYDDDAEPLVFDPLLQMAELHLELAEFLFISFPFQLAVGLTILCSGQHFGATFSD